MASVTFWDIRDGLLDILGYAHPEVAKMTNNIGVIEYCRGNLEEAHRSFKIAHDYQNRRNEKEMTPIETESLTLARANSLNNIGFVLAKMGESTRAVELMKSAIALYEKVLPGDDPTIAIVQGNINQVLHSPPTSSGSSRKEKAWASEGGCHLTPICFAFD